MTQWEYLKIDLNELPPRTDEIDLLNDAGARGWELVCIAPKNTAYLRRQVATQAAQSSRSPRRKTTPG